MDKEAKKDAFWIGAVVLFVMMFSILASFAGFGDPDNPANTPTVTQPQTTIPVP